MKNIINKKIFYLFFNLSHEAKIILSLWNARGGNWKGLKNFIAEISLFAHIVLVMNFPKYPITITGLLVSENTPRKDSILTWAPISSNTSRAAAFSTRSPWFT